MSCFPKKWLFREKNLYKREKLWYNNEAVCGFAADHDLTEVSGVSRQCGMHLPATSIKANILKEVF